MRRSWASTCAGEPRCRIGSPNWRSSQLPSFGARNTNGTRTRHWPRRPEYPPAAIEAIRRGDTPSFEKKDEALVYQICTELFKSQRLSDTSFDEAVATLGETGLIEVIAIIGYYTLIGNTLNVFQVAVPEGTAPPFPE